MVVRVVRRVPARPAPGHGASSRRAGTGAAPDRSLCRGRDDGARSRARDASVALGETTTLRLVEHETFDHKLSDGESFGGLVYDLNRRKVGHDRITCKASTGCHVTEWLQGGNLFGSFAHGGPHFTARITGGTGIYAGARGTVAVAAAPGTNHYTVHLVLH